MDGYGSTQDFFTIGSTASLGGLAGTTFVATNAIGKAFAWNRQLVGFGVALVSSFGLAAYSAGVDLNTYLFAFVNAIYVYLTALGATSVIERATAPPGEASRERRPDGPHFLKPWV
jgi:hypothetical protein